MGKSKGARIRACAVATALVSGLLMSFGAWSSSGASAKVSTEVSARNVPPAMPSGYWLAGTDGSVYPLGDAGNHGSASTNHLAKPIVGMAADPKTGGYWLAATDGGVFAFGAGYYGSTGNIRLAQPIVGMAATPDGGGYWLVARDGGIFAFGDARFYGSTGSIHLNRPVVGMAASYDGRGYWLVASDGGIFTFGDARFEGSTGSIKLAKPIVGMAADPLTGGYWMVASDGGVFTFDASFYGSNGGSGSTSPVVGVAASPTGKGYWIVAANGTVSHFGDAPMDGSVGALAPVTAIATSSALSRCWAAPPPGTPGVDAGHIYVGNISTQNGPVPQEYTSALYGVEAYARYVNSQGGLCGRQLVVDSGDDQFSQSRNQSLTASLAPEVLSFVGSYSDQDAGGSSFLSAEGIPDVGVASSPARFNLTENFSPVPQPPGFNLAPYVYIAQQSWAAPAVSHMAILADNDPSYFTSAKAAQAALESDGYKFVFADFTIQPTDNTLNGDPQKIHSFGVQGVVFFGTEAQAGALAYSFYKSGPAPIFTGYTANAYSSSFIQQAGPGGAGTLIPQPLVMYEGGDASSVPMVGALDSFYGAITPGGTPDLYAAYGWLSGMLFAQALGAAPSATRSAVLAELRTVTQFSGAGMVSPDDPAAKSPPSCYILVTFSSGAFVRTPSSGFDCQDAPDYYRSG